MATWPTPRGMPACSSSQNEAQQSPARHARVKSPGIPSRPSAARVSIWAHDGVDRERLVLRGAEGHDARDQVGPAPGQNLGEAAAAAVAYDRRPRALALDERLQAPLEAVHCAAGAGDVGEHARPARVVTGALEPAAHDPKGLVAGQEARDQEHGLVAAVGHALSAEHRITQQRRQLEPQAGFTPEWGMGEGLVHRVAAIRSLVLDHTSA